MQTRPLLPHSLSIKNLTIGFGERDVLKNLSFSISQGELLGVVGESGSGKSITALGILGLLPPGAKIKAGSIDLQLPHGQTLNLATATHEEHRKVRGKIISMIFQEPMTSLNPSMRCGKQVVEALMLHQQMSYGEAKQVCLSLFEEMVLPNPQKVFSSYPHQLSGGQKQRVMIAMALAGNPQWIIADEPTTALDVTVQKEIIGLLKRVAQERKMGVIFISHDLGVVEEISQRIIVLKDGEMVESAPTQTLLHHPEHSYTKGLIACRPPLNTRPLRLPTLQDFISSTTSQSPKKAEPEGIPVDYSQEPIIRISNLSVSYTLKRTLFGAPKEKFWAVNNLSVNLYPGETLGLVGESGCGKTTLGRAILGLTPIDGGEITFREKSLQEMSKAELRRFRQEVQLVFQDPFSSLNPRQTIGQMLMEPLKFYGLVTGAKALRQRAQELLELVAMPTDSYFRYPHEFSGGQRQRIAIARALTVNPKVLICDEMVSALDVSVQAHILNLLNELKRELNLTYLFISHDLSVVKYMSNRVMVMYNGAMEELGLADEVYQSPTSAYTKKLIEAIPGVLG